MVYNKVYLVICIIILLYPHCYSKCDNYILLLEKTSNGWVEYKPIVIHDRSNFTITDVKTNKPIEIFDINCVIDLSCAGTSTTSTKIIKPIRTTGSDTRVTTPYYIPTEPPYISSDVYKSKDEITTNIPEINFTVTINKEHIDNISNVFDVMKDKSHEDVKLTPTELPIEPTMKYEYETTELDEDNKDPIVVLVPGKTDDTLVGEEKNEFLPVTSRKPTINDEDKDTTAITEDPIVDDTTIISDVQNDTLLVSDGKNETVRNGTGNGALFGKSPEASMQVASKILAGALGAVAAGVGIFAAKKMIQTYMQSGVYRIP